MARPGDARASSGAVNGRAIPDRPDAVEFGRLAMELHDAGGVEETVDAIVQFALQALHCKAAGVALVTHGKVEVLASTDPGVAALYRLQIEYDAGPMLTAVRQRRPVVVADVDADTQWPQAWRELACATGIRSAVQLPLGSDGVAAVLGLYSDVPKAFDTDDLAVAHILARHAAVAIANARQEASLMLAVDARKLVGQAMGILMERYGLDGDRAFEVLKRYSQQTNRKLRDVAEELIATRKLPQ